VLINYRLQMFCFQFSNIFPQSAVVNLSYLPREKMYRFEFYKKGLKLFTKKSARNLNFYAKFLPLTTFLRLYNFTIIKFTEFALNHALGLV